MFKGRKAGICSVKREASFEKSRGRTAFVYDNTGNDDDFGLRVHSTSRTDDRDDGCRQASTGFWKVKESPEQPG